MVRDMESMTVLLTQQKYLSIFHLERHVKSLVNLPYERTSESEFEFQAVQLNQESSYFLEFFASNAFANFRIFFLLLKC